MTDKEFKAKKKKIYKIFDTWSDRMGLGWYKISVNWKVGDAPDKGGGYHVAAEISSQWMYRTADLTIWIEEFPDDEKGIEKIIVHELCHIFVNPLRSQSSKKYDFDLEEYCVESLTSAFLWTYEDGIKKGKK